MHDQPFRSRPLSVGRSTAVCTPHILATTAASSVLAAGGNAVDAAVCAAAVCVVVQPFSSSLAGVGWAMVHDAPSASTQALEFCGTVPRGLDVARLPVNEFGLVDLPRLESDGRALDSSLSPSVAAGWSELIRARGRWPLARVLEPAIELAEGGFPVSALLHRMIGRHFTRLARWPSTVQIFLPDGRPPAVGSILVQPDLARSLRRLAEFGPDELRSGETARALIEFYLANGSRLGPEDLARQPRWHQPLTTTFRGHTVLLAPAPLGDVSFASALQVFDRFEPFGGPDDPAYVHASIESAKLIGRDRARYVGDRTTPDQVQWLLSVEHTAELYHSVGEQARSVAVDATSGDTITLCVIDGDGSAVNLMQTVGQPFGTAAVAPSTGMLTNSSASFAYPRNVGLNDLRAGGQLEQNPCLPIVLDADARVQLVVGSPGGKTRVETVRQMLVNVLDFGMDVQQAVDAPRFLRSPDGQSVRFEAKPAAPTARLVGALQARGHRVTVVDDTFGTGQSVAAGGGAVSAGADWRLESAASAD
jgi:gamma-glutamyltranspeptidase / glutathione hydrolase